MAWFRVVGPEPPDEFAMNHWESQGYSVQSVVGPCPTIDRKTGKPSGSVFCVYLHRSILAPDEASISGRPGWPQNRKAPQAVTDSGDDDKGKLN